MVKTRSGKKMHNLCENVPSKTKKKTKTYSASDEVTNDKIKIIGIRKSDSNMAKSSAAEMMKKHREIRKIFKKSEYNEYKEKERIRRKNDRDRCIKKRKWSWITN